MLKKMKLTQKLAVIIGVILAVSLTVLVGITVKMSENAITEATYGRSCAGHPGPMPSRKHWKLWGFLIGTKSCSASILSV